MQKYFHKKWWKILGIVILLYAFSTGFLVPLRPGVIHISPDSVEPGADSEIIIQTYNTFFDEPNHELSVYLKLDSVHVLEADAIEVLSRKSLKAHFTIQGLLPNGRSFGRPTLIIYDSVDGYLVTPSALRVVSDNQPISTGHTAWNDKIVIHKVPWTFRFPFRGILYETIRNTFFHVAIWFAMFFLLSVSLVYSYRYLRSEELIDDALASSFAYVAILFGVMGMITGSIWAKNTWGAYWTNDPKLNLSAVAVMIYISYAILRSSIKDEDRRAKICAAYNVFAFIAMIPLVMIIPRLTSSLHPGNGGNPALGGEDLDNTLRMVFYPSIIGLILLGTWMSSLLFRIRNMELTLIEKPIIQN